MKQLIILILFDIYSAVLYNVAKAFTDSLRDYRNSHRIIQWLEKKGLTAWLNWMYGSCDSNGSSYFRDCWHFCEWIKEFAFWGCVWVNFCFRAKSLWEIFYAAVIIASFWLGGRVFVYLYNDKLKAQ
jgi:hypothetical protein